MTDRLQSLHDQINNPYPSNTIIFSAFPSLFQPRYFPFSPLSHVCSHTTTATNSIPPPALGPYPQPYQMPTPYSDNLCPADDESEALSPTDGYFHASSSASPRPRPLVPNILVEDPTLASRESKAERVLSSDAGASSSDHHQESSGRSMASPSLQHEAPPAYSPSSSTNYQTFSTMGQEHRAEEQRPLLSHGPESMSSPPSEEPSRWRRLKTSSVAKINLRRRLRTILGVFVIISVIVILLGIFIDDSSDVGSPPLDVYM